MVVLRQRKINLHSVLHQRIESFFLLDTFDETCNITIEKICECWVKRWKKFAIFLATNSYVNSVLDTSRSFLEIDLRRRQWHYLIVIDNIDCGRESLFHINVQKRLLTYRSLGSCKKGCFYHNLLSLAASWRRSPEVQRMRLYARLLSHYRRKRRRYYKSSNLCSLRQPRGIISWGKSHRWNAFREPAMAAAWIV